MKLSTLIESLPKLKETQVSTAGYIIWGAWASESNSVVEQTINDYGGLPILIGEGQGIWFFFSSDVFLASGRLVTWSKFNNIDQTLVILPATLLVGNGREMSIAIDSELASQELSAPEGFTILVHPSAREAGAIPGISFEVVTQPAGLSSVEWAKIAADPRLDYKASLGCIAC